MSRHFTVPLTITVEVKVPDNEGIDQVRGLVETLLRKRLDDVSWGKGNPWTAEVNLAHGYQIGNPEEEQEDDEDEYHEDDFDRGRAPALPPIASGTTGRDRRTKMENAKFFLLTAHDGRRWLADEVAEGNPIPRVRQLLGGRWETTKRYEEFNMRVFFNGARRVVVISFKPEFTAAMVSQALREIHEGREDLS